MVIALIESIYSIIHDTITDKVEVVDDNDKPLMIMPVEEVHKQPLGHRVVLTLLYDAKGRVYLQRRAKTKHVYPDRWDLSSTGHVLAGESRENAALRELNEELAIFPGKVSLITAVPASKETDYAWVSLFSARLAGEMPTPNPKEVSEGMFADADDVATMVEHFEDLLTPAVLWAYREGFLFPNKPKLETALVSL